MKKKPQEWADDEGILIMDYDGWRDKDINEPVTFEEYTERVVICTIATKNFNKVKS